MVLVHVYREITATATMVKLLTVPEGKVAEIVTLIVTNKAAADATVDLFSGDMTNATYDYQITSIVVRAGDTRVLDHNDLKGLKAIRDIYIQTDQQPIRVTLVADIK